MSCRHTGTEFYSRNCATCRATFPCLCKAPGRLIAQRTAALEAELAEERRLHQQTREAAANAIRVACEAREEAKIARAEIFGMLESARFDLHVVIKERDEAREALRVAREALERVVEACELSLGRRDDCGFVARTVTSRARAALAKLQPTPEVKP